MIARAIISRPRKTTRSRLSEEEVRASSGDLSRATPSCNAVCGSSKRRKWFGNDSGIRESAFRASSLHATALPDRSSSRKRLAEDGAKRLISFSPYLRHEAISSVYPKKYARVYRARRICRGIFCRRYLSVVLELGVYAKLRNYFSLSSMQAITRNRIITRELSV